MQHRTECPLADGAVVGVVVAGAPGEGLEMRMRDETIRRAAVVHQRPASNSPPLTILHTHSHYGPQGPSQDLVSGGEGASAHPKSIRLPSGPYTGFNDGGGKAQFSTTGGGGKVPKSQNSPKIIRVPPYVKTGPQISGGGSMAPLAPPCIRAWLPF